MKISNRIKTLAAGVATVVGAGLKAGVVSAADGKPKVYCPDGKVANGGDLSGCDNLKGGNNGVDLISTVRTIIQVIVGVLGFVAVVVIILGGVQYTTSSGDPAKVKKAKDTILYGIIGLVVALLAYAIVNFVLSSLSNAS